MTLPGNLSSHWWDRRMVALDLETTSPEPEEARIVTGTVAYVGGGLETEVLSLIADPGVEIPEDAAAIHGITTERARAEGHPAKDVVQALITAAYTGVGAGFPPPYPLVVFNAPYDLTVLDREARRHQVSPLTVVQPDLLVVDPLTIDKHLDRYRSGSRKLEAVCAHYGALLDGAHDATSDAIAAARLAWVLGAKGRVIRKAWNDEMRQERFELMGEWEEIREDLELLHRAQVRWAAFQARGLAEHFEREGKPEHVDEEWPVVPVKVVA